MNKTENPTLTEYRNVHTELSAIKTKLHDISKKKEYWFEKKESLKKEIKDLIKEIKDLKVEMDKKSTEVRTLKEQRKKYNSEVKDLVNKIKKLHSEKEKAFEEYNGKIEPAKLLEKINYLEKKVEIETNFEREKKLMEEIKKLKRAYEESAEAFKLIQESRTLDHEIRNSRKKADEFHHQIRMMTQDNNYQKFLDISKKITALKQTQEEAFNLFIEHKNEYNKVSQELKQKQEHQEKLKSFIEKDKGLLSLERDMKK
ncbi:MAG: hypothetical protein WC595_04320, partial [Candidatus Nanoarchaeia archaeon]